MKNLRFFLVWACMFMCANQFLAAQTLPAPVNAYPADKATNLPSTLSIKWFAVPGADQYKVSVSTPNHSNDIAWDSTYTDTSYLLSNLPNGTYLWRIKAKHAADPYIASAWAGAWTFTVGSGNNGGGGGGGGGGNSLTNPSLISPSNGSTLQVLGTNLTWTPVSGATFYKLKVASDAAMTNIIFSDNNVTATSRVVPNLTYNTTYYWNVVAANASTQSSGSNIFSLKTMPDNPNAVVTHPRLWITPASLPTLQSWAVASNPVYTAMQNALSSAISSYNTKFFPGGQPNPNWPDNGGTTWSGYVTETYAEFFAFWSLIDPVPANRILHAQRARNLLMYVINQANLGPAAGVPFRDPAFMTYDRSRVYGEAFGLTVDWIYNAKDAANNNILTAADKAAIRTVFMRWCKDQLTAYNHPTPIGLVNDKQMLTNRWVLNNYYSGHARNMTLMSLALDASDDPSVDPTLPYSALGNSLRSYLYNATGAWLYQQYSQYEIPSIVAADYGVSPNFPSLGLGSGGLPVEGALYGESLSFVAGGLLALQTAGWSDENIIGKQAKLITSGYWPKFMDGLLHSVTPLPKVYPQQSYLGPIYQAACYGDLLRTWITPEYVTITGTIGLLAQLKNDQSCLDKTRWYSRNILEGGASNLSGRVSNIWGNCYATNSILYYMLLKPNASTPPDPRPSLPTSFNDPAFRRLLSRTDWTTNATWFNWQCHWTTINHQSGDGNQFEFFRKGEWLIKEHSGYTNDGIGYTSEFHNTLGLQNDFPANIQWFEGPTSQRGGQWTNGVCAGDPTTLTSLKSSFVYAFGDATNLYNRYNATDITHASRSIVWLKPDHIIVYDRAISKTANRFKRFFLQFTALPTVSGKNATVSTPGGQKVYLSNLLPAAGVLTSFPTENLNATAELEPTNSELKIEDPSNPTSVRFLNVLQGADGGTAKDTAILIASKSGNVFDGVFVKNTAVMFPNTWGTPFTYTTYTVPATVTSQIVTGLTPLASYNASSVSNGSNFDMTITPGNQFSADSGGVVVIPNIGIPILDGIAGMPAPAKNITATSSSLKASPNPFNQNTIISYGLPVNSTVTLKIIDLNGKTVAVLASNEKQSAGQHEIVFRANNLPSGTYMCEMISGRQRSTVHLVVSR